MRERRRSVLLLSGAALVLFLVGAGFIGAYFVLKEQAAREPAVLESPPPEWAPAEAINEQLALLLLAGWTDQAVIELGLPR